MSMYRSISLKDLEKYYSCGERTAASRKKELQCYFKKRRITVYDLAIYEGYPVHVLEEYLF